MAERKGKSFACVCISEVAMLIAAGHKELLKANNLLNDLLTTWKVTRETKAIPVAFQRD